MKVLFDTHVILDVLLDRKEFVELSAGLVSLVETKDEAKQSSKKTSSSRTIRYTHLKLPYLEGENI